MKFFTTIILCLLLSPLNAKAESYSEFYRDYSAEGFTDKELVTLFQSLVKTPNPKRYVRSFLHAVANPYAPENSHTGDKFFKALSWYNDTTKGNRDGLFTLRELNQVIRKEVNTYCTHLQKNSSEEDRIGSWKMIQKLKLLEREIKSFGQRGYKYQPRAMFEINHDSPWNASHTINNNDDFQRRVIQASYTRPVLVKYGLTYCVHCLLLENLGSVPAVEKKYRDSIDVYKIWWNPKSEDYTELNQIAKDQGVTSSPYFILYKDGKQIQTGYTFPDENGNGMEKFLAPVL